MTCLLIGEEIIIHGRSGRVALPRVKVTPARPARAKVACLPARRAVRAADVRRSAEAMFAGELW